MKGGTITKEDDNRGWRGCVGGEFGKVQCERGGKISAGKALRGKIK